MKGLVIMVTSPIRDWLLAGLVVQLNRIERKINIMGAREDAAYARQEELIRLVAEGSRAKDVQIAALESELANADANAQQRVDAALEADSEFDAGKVERGNVSLEELVSAPPVTPPASDPEPQV